MTGKARAKFLDIGASHDASKGFPAFLKVMTETWKYKMRSSMLRESHRHPLTVRPAAVKGNNWSRWKVLNSHQNRHHHWCEWHHLKLSWRRWSQCEQHWLPHRWSDCSGVTTSPDPPLSEIRKEAGGDVVALLPQQISWKVVAASRTPLPHEKFSDNDFSSHPR